MDAAPTFTKSFVCTLALSNSFADHKSDFNSYSSPNECNAFTYGGSYFSSNECNTFPYSISNHNAYSQPDCWIL